jgi:type IV fimbrial biogenesis protein FimT
MRNSSGFTLIEVIIAIAVFAILATVAIPNYIGWLPKRHLRSSIIDVQSAINLARFTAIRENTDVVLTFDTAAESYLAYIDTDEDGSQDAGERTVRSKGMSPGINLESTDFDGDELIFNSRGLIENNINTGDMVLTNKNGDGRTITLTITGMSRIE